MTTTTGQREAHEMNQRGAHETELCEAREKLKQEQPHLHAREQASVLGVPEEALLELEQGEDIVRLQPDIPGIFAMLRDAGEIMAITRNDAVVHERKDAYVNPEFGKGPGLVTEDIDLRIFTSLWKRVWSVDLKLPQRRLRSLQFYDASGTAIHKVYFLRKPSWETFNQIRSRFALAEPSVIERGEPGSGFYPVYEDRQPDQSEREGISAAWSALQDTHHFASLVAKFRLPRTRLMRAVQGEWAHPLATTAHREVLEAAAASGQPIMAFVGNPACIQIYSGPVQKVEGADGWFNVLDERFNLHIREELLREAWLVRKPTRDGEVRSVEILDREGRLVLQFFGARKPGQPERPDWRELLEGLSRA